MAVCKNNGFNFKNAIFCLGGMTTIYLVTLSVNNPDVGVQKHQLHRTNSRRLPVYTKHLKFETSSELGQLITRSAKQGQQENFQSEELKSMEDLKSKEESSDYVNENLDLFKIKEPNNPSYSKVLIIGYKRGGTSFFGDLLHNYPNTQYLFEPLIGIYGHMYMGKVATPWAIRIHSNGTIRSIPEYEETYVMSQLLHLLNCNYQNIHPHVYTTFGPLLVRTLDMAECRQNDTNALNHKECGRNVLINKIPNYCINPDVLPKKQDQNPDQLRSEIVSKYKDFNDPATLRKGVPKCREFLQKQCHNSSTIVIKLIRSSMATAIKLLKRDADIKVIHLIRDPRGIQDSRRRMFPGYGFIRMMNISESAGLLCKLMLNDSMTVKVQPPQLRSRILQVRYEDVLLNKNTSLKTITNFLEQADWSPLATWMDRIDCKTLKNGTKTCTKGIDSMNKWRNNLDVIDQTDMAKSCAEALKHFGYPDT